MERAERLATLDHFCEAQPSLNLFSASFFISRVGINAKKGEKYKPLSDSDIKSGLKQAPKLETDFAEFDRRIDKALEVSNKTLQRTITI